MTIYDQPTGHHQRGRMTFIDKDNTLKIGEIIKGSVKAGSLVRLKLKGSYKKTPYIAGSYKIGEKQYTFEYWNKVVSYTDKSVEFNIDYDIADEGKLIKYKFRIYNVR